jgi:1,4-alpha-glucan branching enzyme
MRRYDMSIARSIKKTKNSKITFSFQSDDANEVILMGNFNNWNPEKYPMKKNENGTWEKIMTLPPGEYEYKFLVDGEWKIDPQNFQTNHNNFGTLNSIINLS